MTTPNPGKALQPHQSAILCALLVSALAYLLPPIHALFLPIQYLDTHLHEMCHALVAVATGGTPREIEVFANGSGVTPISGGVTVLEASAGYMGATLIGSAMILFGRTPERARAALIAVACMLVLSMVLWVRGDAVGVVSGLCWAVALFAGGWFLRGMPALFVCQLVGIEQCLNSIGAVYELLRISVYTEAHSDAVLMADVTYIPAAVWASLWCLFSILMVGLTVRNAWVQRVAANHPAS